MNVRAWLATLFALGVLARNARAQAASGSSPFGVWRGTSLCLVRPSPCHDEVVVYRISRVNAGDSLAMDARKIVNAREEEMASSHASSPRKARRSRAPLAGLALHRAPR